jgi:hypothetical protein
MSDLVENNEDPRNPERKEKEESKNLGLIGKGEQGNQFRCTVFEGIQGTRGQQRRLGIGFGGWEKKKKTG